MISTCYNHTIGIFFLIFWLRKGLTDISGSELCWTTLAEVIIRVKRKRQPSKSNNTMTSIQVVKSTALVANNRGFQGQPCLVGVQTTLATAIPEFKPFTV